MRKHPAPRIVSALALLAILATASTAPSAAPARPFRMGYAPLRMATPGKLRRRVQLLRIMFSKLRRRRRQLERRLPARRHQPVHSPVELTRTRISRDSSGERNHVLLRLTDDLLFQCPFIMMTEVGNTTSVPRSHRACANTC
jgi:hypothetical protein